MTSPAFIEHPDYMALRRASMDDLVATLESVSHGQDDPALPRATRQVADVILGRAIRTIRTGTLDEALDATLALSRVLMGPLAERLAERDPDALKLVTAAELTLAAAYAPDSEAGQVPALRKWNGRAVDIVALLRTAPGKALPRVELRERLRIEDESHLSHILRDLEIAGLIRRSRIGRSVTVHLGPTADDDDVLEAIRARQQNWRSVIQTLESIAARDVSDADPQTLESLAPIREQLDRFLRGSDDGPRIERATITLEHLECFRDSLIFSLRVEGYQLRDRSPGRASTTVTGSAVWRVRMLADRIVDVEPWAPFFAHSSGSVSATRQAAEHLGPNEIPLGVVATDHSLLFTYSKSIDVKPPSGSSKVWWASQPRLRHHVDPVKYSWLGVTGDHVQNHVEINVEDANFHRQGGPLTRYLDVSPRRLTT